MRFDKLLTLYKLVNTAEKGLKPTYKLSWLSTEFYAERVVGYNRQYAALGANQSIDALVRIWRNMEIKANDYAVLEDENQYRISFVQHLTDEDGLEVTDLTLSRLESNYDVADETEDTV